MEPFIQPPQHFPNPFRELQDLIREQHEAMKELAALASQTSAQASAHNCLLRALVATHPDLRALVSAYMTELDHLADNHSAHGQTQGGPALEAAKQLQDLLLDAMNRQSGAQKGPGTPE